MDFYNALQAASAATLLAGCFYRLVRTDNSTVPIVRLSFYLLFLASGNVLVSPILPMISAEMFTWKNWTTPLESWVFLIMSITAVQISTVCRWHKGTPPEYLCLK